MDIVGLPSVAASPIRLGLRLGGLLCPVPSVSVVDALVQAGKEVGARRGGAGRRWRAGRKPLRVEPRGLNHYTRKGEGVRVSS